MADERHNLWVSSDDGVFRFDDGLSLAALIRGLDVYVNKRPHASEALAEINMPSELGEREGLPTACARELLRLERARRDRSPEDVDARLVDDVAGGLWCARSHAHRTGLHVPVDLEDDAGRQSFESVFVEKLDEPVERVGRDAQLGAGAEGGQRGAPRGVLL